MLRQGRAGCVVRDAPRSPDVRPSLSAPVLAELVIEPALYVLFRAGSGAEVDIGSVAQLQPFPKVGEARIAFLRLDQASVIGPFMAERAYSWFRFFLRHASIAHL